MATILVDVDGPVANLPEAWLMRYNQDYNDCLTVDQIDSWDMVKYVKPECGSKIYSYLDSHIYDFVKPVEGALGGVQELRKAGHRVIFVTSSPEGTGDAKYAWLKRHGFLDGVGAYGDGRVSDDYIEAHDKSLIRGDVLIDDREENVKNFPGSTILFDAPHNRSYQHGNRASSWEHVWSEIKMMSEVVYRLPEKHPTEIRCPEQAAGFRAILDNMYAVHLSKNQDYSPANLAGTGHLGVMVRAWDKVARLMNLHGFKIKVDLLEIIPEKSAANESLEDSWLDLANYSVIALLMRQGKWGR